MADLIYEVHNHLARITLNRPKQLNCFSEEMIRLWTEALEDVRDNDDVYALLLSGNGKAFCAGGDVKAMAAGDGFFESHEDISSIASNHSSTKEVILPQPSQERIHSGRESKEFRFF